MFTNRLFHLLIIFGLLFVTACAPQVEPASTAAPTSTPTIEPTATSTIMPTTTTAPTVIPSVTPTAVPTEVGSFPNGKFVFPYLEGDYFLFKEGRWSHWGGKILFASGTYRVEGDLYFQLTNSGGCPPTSFKFTFDGTNLKFQLTDESRNDTACPDRNGFYDNTTYIFSP